MANDLNTAFTPEIWARDMQIWRTKRCLALQVANYELRDDLKVGDRAHRPYSNFLYDSAYTKGTDVTPLDLDGTDEYLDVDTARVVPFYVDDLDKLQNKWDMATVFANQAQGILNMRMDGAVMDEYSNADNYVDDGNVGGTAGNYITVGTTNVSKIFTAAAAKLDYWEVDENDRVALIGPRTVQVIRDLLGMKDTAFGDKVGQAGHIGRWGGFQLYKTNATPFSAKLAMATNPTEGDTVVIAGVTFTFNATPSGAGSVDIGGSAAVSVDNLVAAINDSGTAGTTYIQLSDTDRMKLRRSLIAATDGTTYLTIAGYGEIVVSETLTAAADVWSLQRQHMLFMIRRAIDMVIQRKPHVQFNQAQLRAGKFCLPITLYGTKTFKLGTLAMVDARIDGSDWT